MQDKRPLLKVIILGDAGAGKTSLFMRYIKSQFSDAYKMTIGADFYSKEVDANGRAVILQLWDTAGQERFLSLGKSFYRGCDCLCIVYDVTRKDSFDAMETWREKFIEMGNPHFLDKFPVVVLANKIDLGDQRVVTAQEGIQWARSRPNTSHFETSAKHDTNVSMAFSQVASAALDYHLMSAPVMIPQTVNRNVQLEQLGADPSRLNDVTFGARAGVMMSNVGGTLSAGVNSSMVAIGARQPNQNPSGCC